MIHFLTIYDSTKSMMSKMGSHGGIIDNSIRCKSKAANKYPSYSLMFLKIKNPLNDDNTFMIQSNNQYMPLHLKIIGHILVGGSIPCLMVL